MAAFAHELNSSVSAAQYALSSVLGEADGQLTDVAQDSEHLRDALLAVRAGIEACASTVNQALEYARLERLQPESEEVNVAGIIAKLNNEFKKSLDKRDINIVVNVDERLHVAVKEAHLYAILRNLVSNACDAIAAKPGSSVGKILITVTRTGNRIEIKVEDNGTGIPEGLRSKIFRPFFTTKGNKGNGIGLGFCRQLAALYAGSIDWVSSPAGTTFNVVLYAGNRDE